MNKKSEATKFFLLFNLAIADKRIDPKEYEILNKYSKFFDEQIDRSDIDFKELYNLPTEEKSKFYIELVEMMSCDGKISREELILCGMIGQVMGSDIESCIELARHSIQDENNLKTNIAKGFLAFVQEYDSNVNRPIAFINDFFQRDTIDQSIGKIRILIFGSNENISLNDQDIISLFNSIFESLGLPGTFTKKNFKMYIDTYSKVKKISNDVIQSINKSEYDYAILGSKPHMLVNGFSGSWKESEALKNAIDSKNIFENHKGFTKSFLKNTITEIALRLGTE